MALIIPGQPNTMVGRRLDTSRPDELANRHRYTIGEKGIPTVGTSKYALEITAAAEAGSPQTVTVAGRTSVSTYGTVTAQPGDVTVTVAGRTSVSSYGTVTVLPGDVLVSVTGHTSQSSYGTVTVLPPTPGPTSSVPSRSMLGVGATFLLLVVAAFLGAW